MKTLKCGPKLSPDLLRMRYFISRKGGASSPFQIQKNHLLIEWLTHGPVMHPETNQPLPAGTVFIHREGQQTVSRCEEEGHYECMAAEFDIRMLPEVPDWPRNVEWPEEEGGVAFAHEMVFRHHHTRLGLEVLGPLIWAQIQYRVEISSRSSRRVPPRISASLREIENNFTQPIQIEALANKIGLSPSHFHARFREVMHMTPHRYLVQQRIRAARHRLVTTSDPVKAIAFDVGYANTENFCRAFKKETGMTAAQFRNVNQAFSASSGF